MLQVATALLVADLSVTLWIPGQTLFASSSSYSKAVCINYVGGSLWLIPINAQYTQDRIH